MHASISEGRGQLHRKRGHGQKLCGPKATAIRRYCMHDPAVRLQLTPTSEYWMGSVRESRDISHFQVFVVVSVWSRGELSIHTR